MNMDLNKLKIFKEVAQAGSFSKAAVQLKRPKSRVSRIISELEQELGIQLIHRTTRQFQLTTAGRELFSKITPLMNEISNTVESVASETEEISGIIKMTAPQDIASELVSKLAYEFMQLYPKIQIVIHASNHIVNLIEESIDLSIRISRAKDSTMIQKKLGSVGSSIVMSPEMYKKYRPEKIEELESLPYLTYEVKDLRTSKIKVSNLKSTKTLKLKPTLGSNNFFVIRQMALLGSGFAAIPTFLVKDNIAKGELIQVFKEWNLESMPIQILLPHQKEVPKRLRKFIDYIAPRMIPYFS